MKKKRLAKTRKHITVDVPEDLLKDVDWLAPLEDLTREELILGAVRRFLKPHLDIRERVLQADKGETYGPIDTGDEMIAARQKRLKKRAPAKGATNAISKSTDKFKTGRYEP
jgi:hypothetical protein